MQFNNAPFVDNDILLEFRFPVLCNDDDFFPRLPGRPTDDVGWLYDLTRETTQFVHLIVEVGFTWLQRFLVQVLDKTFFLF